MTQAELVGWGIYFTVMTPLALFGWTEIFRVRWPLRFWNSMKDALRSILMVFVRPFERVDNLAELRRGEIVFAEAVNRGYNTSTGLDPWTPMERAALGIDDNEKWIRETQQILNEIEWDRLTQPDDTEVAPAARLR